MVLILEDNEERIREFTVAVAALGSGFQLRIWRDAPAMLSESPTYFAETCLISLDHDLTPQPGSTQDPGTGLDVAASLAKHKPFCPVIIHTSNYERRWSMHNEFRFGGWTSEIVAPLGEGWIRSSWLQAARKLIGFQSLPSPQC